MSPDPNTQICPHCGKSSPAHLMACAHCNSRLSAPPAASRSRAHSSFAWAGSLRGPLKFATVCLLIAACCALLYWAVTSLFRQVEESSIYPDDPAVTATEFFTALAEENYQECYKLMVFSRKVATAIGQQSRQEGYFPHFRRIRDYLVLRSGEDFAYFMEVSPKGKRVEFPGGIVLRVQMEVVPDLGKNPHYAVEGIREFPVDVTPQMGIEQRNRGLNRVMESLEALGQEGDVDNAAEVLAPRAGERDSQRLSRLVNSYKNARHVDTRHVLLEHILDEYGLQKQTQTLLMYIARAQSEAEHLRAFAEQALMGQ